MSRRAPASLAVVPRECSGHSDLAAVLLGVDAVRQRRLYVRVVPLEQVVAAPVVPCWVVHAIVRQEVHVVVHADARILEPRVRERLLDRIALRADDAVAEVPQGPGEVRLIVAVRDAPAVRDTVLGVGYLLAVESPPYAPPARAENRPPCCSAGISSYGSYY